MKAFGEGTYQVWSALISTEEYEDRRKTYIPNLRQNGFVRFSESDSQRVLVDRNWQIRFVVRGGATLAGRKSIGTKLTYLGPGYESFISFYIKMTDASKDGAFPIFDASHVLEGQKSEFLLETRGDPWSELYWGNKPKKRLPGK